VKIMDYNQLRAQAVRAVNATRTELALPCFNAIEKFRTRPRAESMLRVQEACIHLMHLHEDRGFCRIDPGGELEFDDLLAPDPEVPLARLLLAAVEGHHNADVYARACVQELGILVRAEE
jgi:hypothetical protein